ncbi:MAG: WG repeat-containing protein [Bacteroidota bacterium]
MIIGFGRKTNNMKEGIMLTRKITLRYPMGKYAICYTDTFRTFAIVLMKGGFFGIDKKEKILFEVYPFDNGPDPVEGGLFRIRQNDLIGFANIEGKIVIRPRFNAVLTFRNNLAPFCEGCTLKGDGEHKSWVGGKWGAIDKRGNVVIEPAYDLPTALKQIANH